MDILTHMVAGLAIGTTIAASINTTARKKTGIIAAGALGGVLPDIDAISLWSKFDSTFGKLFGLQHSGADICSAKFWYSHHAFMHSLLACLLFVILVLLINYLVVQRFRRLTYTSAKTSLKNNKRVLLSFTGGFIAHLLCDMVTPAGSWGGINLFFPLNSYSGGFGKVWWWNNYDIFLILAGVVLINCLLLFINYVAKVRLIHFAVCFFTVGILLIIMQINSRDFKFNYSAQSSKTYQMNEAKSKDIQQQLLGKKLYNKMVYFDNLMPFHF